MHSPLQNLPPLIAHRGAADRAPENTEAAFIEAAAAGAHFVEIDVRLSADGELVVFHDPTLERTTEGIGLVRDHTREQLTLLDAGAWFGDEYRGECIPALDVVLPLLEELDLGVNVELKAEDAESAAATAHAFVQLMFAHSTAADGVLWPGAMLVSSLDVAALEVLAAELPATPRALVLERPTADSVATAVRLGCAHVHVNHRVLRNDLIKEALSADLMLGAYTVNDPDRAEQLWDLGITAVFSDVPDLPAVPQNSDPDDPKSGPRQTEWNQRPPAA